MRPLLFILSICLFVSPGRAADPFEIKDGDRVLFLGDVLLEREGTYGYLETRMHEQFPNRKFTVRNLSFSGDTPLGLSRASFDPPDKAFPRLKEQLALVKPTVVFLGYGMAASLQEITDRSGDITLNRDVERYGTEPYSAARFKKELAQLMDAINAVDPATKVRFVMLSPIKHEDLRKLRPGLPDPTEHNKLLGQYSKVIEELAKERSARFVPLPSEGLAYMADARPKDGSFFPSFTENGIHASPDGWDWLSTGIGLDLGWRQGIVEALDRLEPQSIPATHKALRAAIIKKNEFFFHRWRPENHTYLFGFRKHEQGQNGKEIPEFDSYIDAGEAEIDKLKRQPAKAADGGDQKAGATAQTAAPPAPAPAKDTLPLPQFDTDPALEISLWAENPLLEKPTEMNWDAAGRLWVCSSGLYPQIAPGEPATDTILVIEDTDHDGKGDKSTVFADGLLIPTGVEADLKADGKMACYVGQSTELLYFEDTDGDGKADKKRIVLSGFGTEDTHHILHTLRWGPDGRLHFNQSIYIHSHLETPWGMVRMNSGAVMAYDPRTERVEVSFKGFCNPWGHAWDQWGQEFVTDGAGFQGVSWGILGAQYFTYENGRRILQSVSPGNYPKFAGLELIQSPHFPADWQGNAITCDFRAHRIVRFQINDLGDPQVFNGGQDPRKSGYVTKEMPDICRTADVSFRPIDVKLGPDGALYIADWSNPVINHGEVDFRDPRRDHTHGRIWRISVKGSAPAKLAMGKERFGTQDADPITTILKALSNGADAETMRKLPSLVRRFTGEMLAAQRTDQAEEAVLNAEKEKLMKLRESDPGHAAIELEKIERRLGNMPDRLDPISALKVGARASVPRVRIEAMRALARFPDSRSTEIVLDAALNAPKDDPYYAYAAAMSINDLAEVWTATIAEGWWVPDSPEKQRQLAWGLDNIRPDLASATLAKLMADRKVPLDGTDPWLGLIGRAGGPHELQTLFHAAFTQERADAHAASARICTVLAEAARTRNVRPDGDRKEAGAMLIHYLDRKPAPADAAAALRLMGTWKLDQTVGVAEVARDNKAAGEIRYAAIEALRSVGSPAALKVLDEVTKPENELGMRRAALAAIAQIKLDAAVAKAPEVLTAIANENEAVETWRALLTAQGAPEAFAAAFTRDAAKWANVPKPPAIRAAREAGQKGQPLTNALAGTPPAGKPMPRNVKEDIKRFSEQAVTNGHPIDGEAIYHRIGCAQCHSIGGAGGKFGPDFTSLGASAPLDYIVESLFDPTSKVKEGYIAFAFTMKDGSQMNGIPTRETATEQFIRVGPGPEIPLVKANIAKRDSVGSMMPAGLIDPLNDNEKLDLISFLSQVGKPGPFDASKATVARIWWLFPSSVLASAVTPGAADAPSVLANVNGALPKQRLADTLPLVANAGDGPKAATKFQLATAGKVKLNLTGIREAWLDGQGLAIASEPSPTVDLPAGVHTLAVRLDPKALPETIRVESPEVRFLTE